MMDFNAQSDPGPETPPRDASEYTDEEYWRHIRAVVTFLESHLNSAGHLELLIEWSASHEEWPVRAACIRLLAENYLQHSAAAWALAAATHDSVDWVAFTSIQLVGKYRVREATQDLIKIVGWPSNFTRPSYLRKPVGCGAAFAKHALIEIFGTSDPAQLRILEDAHFAYLRDSLVGISSEARNRDVVYIPAGPFIAGADISEIGAYRVDESDNPRRVIEVEAFYIDRVAVTNSRYREFLSSSDSARFEHPDQPSGKNHVPAHWHDPRFNKPDFPVVGIDWYDAWAFARWAGGMLPDEEQWEKASRGGDGRIYPWGDIFEADYVNYVERSFSQLVPDLTTLEAVLRTTTPRDFPPNPLLPADCLPSGASPYGAIQMSGNVWEMTRTNYFSRLDMDPFFAGRRPAEFINRKEAFYVLRGGAWSSPRSCLATHYRGRDLLTDIHNEIGFRCIYSTADS